MVLRIAPVTETYVCVDTGPDTDIRFEGILTAPQTFRGRRLRVNLGNTSVEVTKNGEPVAIEPSTEPVGFAFTPRGEPLAAAGRAALRVSARAGIVVTGTEVLTGRVRDRNGPWLSDRLLELGVELAHITICGDRPEDMRAQLRFMADQGVDLVITSGGLGPTADDLTIEVVAEFTGRPLFLDEELEERIAEILRPLMKRFRDLDFEAVRAANRKQALVPEGAHVIYPAGTAPGLVVPGQAGDRGAARAAARAARDVAPGGGDAAFQEAVGGRTHYEQQTLRLFGIPESEIAETLRVAEGEVAGLRGARDHHLPAPRRGGGGHPLRAGGRARLAGAARRWSRERHARTLFSSDGSRVDDQVAELLAGRSLAVAESCTGGLMAARLTERPGSSAYFAGGVVAYSNEAKAELLGVDPDADRAPRRGVARGGRGDGRRRAGALRRRHGARDHGRGGPGRGDGGQAGRATCAGARSWPTARRWRATSACPATAPRSATARPRSGMHLLRRLLRGEELPALSGPRARMFVALDLPDRGAGGAGGLARRAGRGPATTCARCAPRRCT